MSTPQERLEHLVDSIRTQNDLPALAAAMVHNFGMTKIYTAKGVRRADKSPSAPGNALMPGDRFPLGSISKAMTGYLLARLVKAHAPTVTWTTRIVDAFPELASADCRRKYGVRDDFLGVTLEQLISEGSGMFDQHGQANPANHRGDPANAPDVWFQDDPGPLQQEWSTREALMYRRFIYAILSMQMPPLFAPGQAMGYGGAPMICAAMVERMLGESFEQLYAAHVFIQAQMLDSKFGRTATSAAPDGVFSHDANRVPNELGAQIQKDFNSHAPAGACACSPHDLACFIEQNLPAHPGTTSRLLTDAEMQFAHQRITGSDVDGVSRCGWCYTVTGTVRQLWHAGDDGSSYAAIRIYPDLGYGVAAAATMSSTVSGAPVGATLDGMETLEKNWGRSDHFGP